MLTARSDFDEITHIPSDSFTLECGNAEQGRGRRWCVEDFRPCISEHDDSITRYNVIVCVSLYAKFNFFHDMRYMDRFLSENRFMNYRSIGKHIKNISSSI